EGGGQLERGAASERDVVVDEGRGRDPLRDLRHQGDSGEGRILAILDGGNSLDALRCRADGGEELRRVAVHHLVLVGGVDSFAWPLLLVPLALPTVGEVGAVERLAGISDVVGNDTRGAEEAGWGRGLELLHHLVEQLPAAE